MASNQNTSYSLESIFTCWEEAKPQGNDTYFSKKKLQPPPIARFGKNPKGYQSTLIALKDIKGELKCLLSLSSGGKFNFGNPKGAFAQLGEIHPEGEFYAGEGIATVQTAWEATQKEIPAVSCGTWSNILPAVAAIKGKYPNAKPIILIDCDNGGNGMKAAQMVANAFPDATFRKPSFESLPNPENEELTDFNDIISKCGQPLDEVLRQLQIEHKLPMSTDAPKTDIEGQPLSFHERLGMIIKDPKFALQLKERSYNVFELEHKRLFSSGGLITGYEAIDDQLYFAKGDFVVVQAMSNHGKSTFMLQMANRFLTEEANRNKNPMCIFVTYESMPIRIEEKWVNLIGRTHEDDTPIKYDRRREEKFLYPSPNDFQSTKATFNHFQKHMHILKKTTLENLEHLIDLYRSEYPERLLILFLDYIQMIETNIDAEGWKEIKAIAYKLESLAIEKEIIIISASQVNENRQAREGRDIYNAATTVIDVFNHSHNSLKINKDLNKEYKEPKNGKNICTFSAVKQKHGSSFYLQDYFLFDGCRFEVNESNQANEPSLPKNISEKANATSKQPKGHNNYL
jgi:hypothetical protein